MDASQLHALTVAIVAWAIVCLFDGCTLGAVAVGSAQGFKPLRWSCYIGVFHFIFGVLGVIFAVFVALWSLWAGYAVTSVAIAFVLFHFVKHRYSHHHHAKAVGNMTMLLLAMSMSYDAIPQGMGIESHFLHEHGAGHEHHGTVSQFGVWGAIAATAVVATLVALFTYVVTLGVRRLSERFSMLQEYLPVVGMILLTYFLLTRVSQTILAFSPEFAHLKDELELLSAIGTVIAAYLLSRIPPKKCNHDQ